MDAYNANQPITLLCELTLARIESSYARRHLAYARQRHSSTAILYRLSLPKVL